MIKAVNRLKKSTDFARVLDTGSKKRFGSLLLFYVKSTADEPIKVGIVVSKKVSKLAVRRNYIRRVLHEKIGTLIKGNPALGGELVVLVLPGQMESVEFNQEKIAQWLVAL